MYKIAYLSVLLFLLNCTPINNVESTHKNKKMLEIENKLLVVKNHLDSSYVDSTLKIIDAVYYLEKTTKIESESDGSDLGKLNPTKNDYEKWVKWYEELYSIHVNF